MKKVKQYSLNVNINGTLPVLPPMHDYAITNIEVKNDKIVFTTNDFISHDYDYSDIVGFKPKTLSIEFCELCDDTFFVEVLRFYGKKQFKEKHKDFGGSRSNSYNLIDFTKFFNEYKLQFNYLSVSGNEVIVFFSCNNQKNKAHEVIIKISCEKVIYTFTN